MVEVDKTATPDRSSTNPIQVIESMLRLQQLLKSVQLMFNLPTIHNIYVCRWRLGWSLRRRRRRWRWPSEVSSSQRIIKPNISSFNALSLFLNPAWVLNLNSSSLYFQAWLLLEVFTIQGSKSSPGKIFMFNDLITYVQNFVNTMRACWKFYILFLTRT